MVGNAARLDALQRSTTRRTTSLRNARAAGDIPAALARKRTGPRLKRLWLRAGHVKRNTCERMNSLPPDVP